MLDYLDIAKKVVDQKYPECDGALMAGSIVRGEGTETSDIDLIIHDENIKKGYRESFVFDGVPVEAFVHNKESFRKYFKQDCARKIPSLLLMVVESIEIRGNEFLDELREEARKRLLEGPPELTEQEITSRRYFITDLRDDLIGSEDDFETILIVNELVVKLHEFYLLTNNAWIGKSKWIKRAIKKYDPEYAVEFEKKVLDYYSSRDKKIILDLIEEVLSPYGGCCFDGFSMGR